MFFVVVVVVFWLPFFVYFDRCLFIFTAFLFVCFLASGTAQYENSGMQQQEAKEQAQYENTDTEMQLSPYEVKYENTTTQKEPAPSDKHYENSVKKIDE